MPGILSNDSVRWERLACKYHTLDQYEVYSVNWSWNLRNMFSYALCQKEADILPYRSGIFMLKMLGIFP